MCTVSQFHYDQCNLPIEVQIKTGYEAMVLIPVNEISSSLDFITFIVFTCQSQINSNFKKFILNAVYFIKIKTVKY